MKDITLYLKVAHDKDIHQNTKRDMLNHYTALCHALMNLAEILGLENEYNEIRAMLY